MYLVFLFFLKMMKLPFAPMNYNALALFSHELPTVLFCSHELRFCAQKSLQSVKVVNLNG
jgi:hypothetical protein